MKLKPARHLVKFWLKLAGFGGICLPPFGVYLLPSRMQDHQLIAHEAVHWRQWEQRGTIGYYFGYLYLLLRHGYRNHPWEIEARES
jgi:hypothetical protein